MACLNCRLSVHYRCLTSILQFCTEKKFPQLSIQSSKSDRELAYNDLLGESFSFLQRLELQHQEDHDWAESNSENQGNCCHCGLVTLKVSDKDDPPKIEASEMTSIVREKMMMCRKCTLLAHSGCTSYIKGFCGFDLKEK